MAEMISLSLPPVSLMGEEDNVLLCGNVYSSMKFVLKESMLSLRPRNVLKRWGTRCLWEMNCSLPIPPNCATDKQKKMTTYSVVCGFLFVLNNWEESVDYSYSLTTFCLTYQTPEPHCTIHMPINDVCGVHSFTFPTVLCITSKIPLTKICILLLALNQFTVLNINFSLHIGLHY